MLTPSYLLQAPEPAEDIAEALHQDILKRIVERILLRFDRQDDYILTALDKWQIETLQEAGYLLEDIQKDIAAATGLMQTEVAEAMEDAGVRALEYDDKIYRDAGLDPIPLTQSPELIAVMQRDYEATVGEWKNFTRTTAEAVQQTFITACDTAYHQAMTGTISARQAVREAVEKVIEDGVYVKYPTGHQDTIETATTRAVRTGISQASAHIQLARMEEYDVELVLISSHLGARPEHQVWQGQIFRRDELEEKTGYGSVKGLCGANCRHSFGPYFEGMTNPYEQFEKKENLEQYEKDQRQRALERRIRATKREVMALKAAADKDDEFQEKYKKKAALLQRQNAAYDQYCEENGLKKRSDRITIAKWDRSQAAQARAAAKKYAVDHPDSVKPRPSAKKDQYTKEEKEEFAQLQKKFKNKTEVMLFGTAEEAIRYDYLLQKDKANAGIFDFYKKFQHQTISESKLNSWRVEPTTKERDAISSYSRSGYLKMNDNLRYKIYVPENVKREIAALHGFLDKCKTQDELYLSRGITKPAVDKMFGDDGWRQNSKTLVGSVFTDKGFVSTTPYQGGGFGGDVVMYIKAPKGTKGAYIKDFAASSDEKEFLLQSDTSFVVRNIVEETTKWGDKKYKIFAEVIL